MRLFHQFFSLPSKKSGEPITREADLIMPTNSGCLLGSRSCSSGLVEPSCRAGASEDAARHGSSRPGRSACCSAQRPPRQDARREWQGRIACRASETLASALTRIGRQVRGYGAAAAAAGILELLVRPPLLPMCWAQNGAHSGTGSRQDSEGRRIRPTLPSQDEEGTLPSGPTHIRTHHLIQIRACNFQSGPGSQLPGRLTQC